MSKQHEGLPRHFIPTNYKIHIYDIDVEKDTFSGDVAIELNVIDASSECLLNVDGLEILDVQVANAQSEATVQVKSFDNNDKSQILTIQLDREVTPTSDSVLIVKIKYSATIRDNMVGFYRSEYTEEGSSEKKVCLSTQFEAASARQAFPCLDEPNFKATFDVKITIDDAESNNWIALSNMPLSDKSSTGNGAVTYIFERSVIMSTYLVAWACGDFEYIEKLSDREYGEFGRIPVRVYTIKGLKERGHFGLETACKAIDYFSKIFELDYPLPKLDLISIPAYSHNAMENYGLITFRETALLFDPETSDASYAQNVAYVVCHECAHQWFGNLVTMNWWDELWLNEGFATWVGYLAVDEFHPEWDIFTSYVSTALQQALSLDSLRGSHPVEVYVHSAADIDQVFDAISYLKGSSIINMLSYSLGVDVFLKGVAIYLRNHKFGNASTKDLWAGVSEAAGVDVNEMMDPWIKKIGYPYVSVSCSADKKKLLVSQRRFLSSGDATSDEDETTWWVPLNILNSDGAVSSDALTQKTLEVALTGDFIKLNKDSFGFYRSSYSPELLANIYKNVDKLSIKDKVGLLADVLASSTAALNKTSSLLDLISVLQKEDDPVIWDQIMKCLNAIQHTWFEQPADVQAALKVFKNELLSPVLKNIGFQAQSTDSFVIKKLRTDLQVATGLNGNMNVAQDARALFSEYQNSGKIEPSSRKYVFQTILSDPEATEADYDFVLKEITSPPAVDSAEIALTAIGVVTNPVLQEKTLDILFTDAVHPMNFVIVATSIGANNTFRSKFLKSLLGNYDTYKDKFGQSLVIWDRALQGSLSDFASIDVYNEIKEFFKDKPLEGFDRGLSYILDRIKTKASWVERDAEDVKDWLSKKQYIFS